MYTKYPENVEFPSIWVKYTENMKNIGYSIFDWFENVIFKAQPKLDQSLLCVSDYKDIYSNKEEPNLENDNLVFSKTFQRYLNNNTGETGDEKVLENTIVELSYSMTSVK